MRKPTPDLGRIPILLVEDNRLVREGIAAILERHADMDVVAAVADAEAAMLGLHDTVPRVVLVDAGLGDQDSLDLVEQIASTFPEAPVIVMDILPDPREVVEFVERGASGFVVKEASIQEFVDTIRAVAGGAQVLPPTLTTTVFSHIAQSAETRPRAGVVRAGRMTPRERQVVDLIAEGRSNKGIARSLGISTHTVKSHVRNILEKLALHSRLQVAAYVHGPQTGSGDSESRGRDSSSPVQGSS